MALESSWILALLEKQNSMLLVQVAEHPNCLRPYPMAGRCRSGRMMAIGSIFHRTLMMFRRFSRFLPTEEHRCNSRITAGSWRGKPHAGTAFTIRASTTEE